MHHNALLCKWYSVADTTLGRRKQMLVEGKLTCQTSLLTPLIVTTHNFCKLVSLFFYEWKRKKANFKLLKQRCQFCRLLKILFFGQIRSSHFWKGCQLKPRTSLKGMPNHIPLQNAGSNQIYEWLELDRTQSIKGQQSHHLDICGVESVKVDCFSMISFVVWFKKNCSS